MQIEYHTRPTMRTETQLILLTEREYGLGATAEVKLIVLFSLYEL
jgi:hypothetical protein